MHEIRLILEDREYETLIKKKGNSTWKDLLLYRIIKNERKDERNEMDNKQG